MIIALNIAGFAALFSTTKQAVGVFMLIRDRLGRDMTAAGIAFMFYCVSYFILLLSWILFSARAEEERQFAPLLILTGIGFLVWLDRVVRQFNKALEWEFAGKAEHVKAVQEAAEKP